MIIVRTKDLYAIVGVEDEVDMREYIHVVISLPLTLRYVPFSLRGK